MDAGQELNFSYSNQPFEISKATLLALITVWHNVPKLGGFSMKKSHLLFGGVVVLCAALAGLNFLASFRPVAVNVPIEDVEAAAKKTGLADCFWVGAMTKDGLNFAYPDTGAHYWITQFKLPEGASLGFSGNFPHARHLSFNTYNEDGQPVDRLNDVLITPEAGATNPFKVGEPRDGQSRAYKFQVAKGDFDAGTLMADIDAKRPVNTLFSPKGDKPTQLWMRIYVPDAGLSAKGGVELPKPSMKLANGSVVEGDELCRQIVLKEGAVRDVHVSKVRTRQLLSLESHTSPHHPAQTDVPWEALFNPPYAMARTLVGTRWQWMEGLLSVKRKGGFYSTLDNTYMGAYVDSRLGDVLVIHAKAPTTPHTLAGNVKMEGGQLRYWSICKYRSLYDTKVDSCLYDQQVPLDANGAYTIVVSPGVKRPTNATNDCGVAWMDWGVGDGLNNPNGGVLFYRNMLPSPDFKQSIFATQAPGDEAATLGELYPKAKYMSRDDFEKLGCKKGN